MTLRADIHKAVDQYVTPAPWLTEMVSDAILAGHTRRRLSRRAAHWLSGVARSGPLAAAAAATLLVVVILLGSRGWLPSAPRTAPSTGVDRAALASLEARPFQFHRLAPGAACVPQTGFTPIEYYGAIQDVRGTGPVYFSGALWTQDTAWGSYEESAWFADRSVRGPILVRATDLTTGDEIVFVGDYAAGGAVGTDVLEEKSVQQRSELVFNASQPSGTSADNGRLWVWYSVDGTKDTQPKCEAWQIDGLDFTQTMVVYRSTLGS